MRVRLKRQASVPPEYLAAFIRSPLGGEQVRRCARGMTSHVYADDVKMYVQVPLPPTDVVAKVTDHPVRKSPSSRSGLVFPNVYAHSRGACARRTWR